MHAPSLRIAVALSLALLVAGGAVAQLPQLGDEDVPRRKPLPPPPKDDPAPRQHTGAETPQASFGETIDVALAFHVVRVLRRDGSPVLDLGPEDFVAAGEDGEPLPVVSADWYATGAPVERWRTPARGLARRSEDGGSDAEDPDTPEGSAPAVAVPDQLTELPGRRVVVFVQADFHGRRIYGHLKQLPNVEALLDGLAPRDQVAVVSFDTHMELWRDFTTDREAAKQALWKAIQFGADPLEGADPDPASADPPSLAALLDPSAMADAAFTENALELLGLALAQIPEDEKVILFLGWGLGRYGAGGFRMRPDDYPPAVAALRRANATVFSLDIMDAASHTLEAGLKRVATDTGGVYLRTATNPMQAFRRVAQALSGYYLVAVDVSSLDPGRVTFATTGPGRGARVSSHAVRPGLLESP